MHKEETPLIIEKVGSQTFDNFLGLICKLAEYEKLAPPIEQAKQRLRRDCLSDKPKYQAFMGKVGDKYTEFFR